MRKAVFAFHITSSHCSLSAAIELMKTRCLGSQTPRVLLVWILTSFPFYRSCQILSPSFKNYYRTNQEVLIRRLLSMVQSCFFLFSFHVLNPWSWAIISKAELLKLLVGMDLMKAMALPVIRTYLLIHAHVKFCLQLEGFVSLCGSLWRSFLELGPRPELWNQNLEGWYPGICFIFLGICIFISFPSKSLETIKSETSQLSVHRFPFKNVYLHEKK